MNGSGPKNFRSPSHESTLETLTKTIEGLEEKIFGRSMAPNKPVLPGDQSYASDKQAAMERAQERAYGNAPTTPGHYAYPNDNPHQPYDSTARSLRDEIRLRQAKLSVNAPSDQKGRSNYSASPSAQPTYENTSLMRSALSNPTAASSMAASPAISSASSFGPEPSRAAHSSHSANPDLLSLLSDLRQELRNDIEATLSEGFMALQRDVEAFKSAANQQQVPLAIREDLEKIAHSINQFDTAYTAQTNSHGSQQAIDSLRLEVDSLRTMIDKVAREETLTSLDNRWGSIERNLRDFQPTLLHADVSSLASRLDDIRSAVDVAAQPESFLQPLADKVEHIALAISELLDRGKSGLDHQHLTDFGTQMDARLNQLVDKVDQMVTADQYDMTSRIDQISKRLDDLMSEGMLANLEERIANLQQLVEQGAQDSDLPLVNVRLQELSDKMDAMDGRASSIETAGIERLVGQLAHIADQLDAQRTAQGEGDGVHQGLGRVEAQLEEIRHRFDQSVEGAPQPNLNLLHDRTEQVLDLVRNFSTEDIDERLNALQEHLDSNDDFILEAARRAAEEALKAADITPSESFDSDAERAFLLSLSDEVKALDQMQRQRDDESRVAFTHVHDTLYKIVDRLDQMGEQSASNDRQKSASSAPLNNKASGADALPDAHATAEASIHSTSDRNVLTGALAIDDRAVADHSVPDLAPELTSDESSNRLGQQAEDDSRAQASAENTQSEDKTLQAQNAQSSNSLLSNIAGRMREGTASAGEDLSKQSSQTQSPQLAASDDEHDNPSDDIADQPLEPGSGAPDLNSIMQKVQEVQRSNHRKNDDKVSGHADPEQNIAAVRRAALIAAAEAAKAQEAAEAAQKAGEAANKKPLIRKPILIGGTIALIAILAFPTIMSFFGTNVQNTDGAVADSSLSVTEPDGATAPALADPELANADQSSITDNASAAAPEAPSATNGFNQPQDVANNSFTLPQTSQGQTLSAPAINQTLPSLENGVNAAPVNNLPDGFAPEPLIAAAQNGDPLALYEVGARYADGRGTLVDTNEAINWFSRAAKQGFAPAQYRLGNIYEKGVGVAQDVALAKDYYRDAAANGHVKSMHNLGVIYASDSEEQDLTLAAEWFKRAADYGVKDSQVNIAILYARGDGVDRNLVESYKWFAIAAKNGDAGAADMRDQVFSALPQNAVDGARNSVNSWQALPVDALVNDVQVPDSWNGDGTNTASIDVRKAIRNIQAILNNNGFDAGPADGVIGKQTISAIKQFQASIGMAPNGEVSDELVRELLSRNG